MYTDQYTSAIIWGMPYRATHFFFSFRLKPTQLEQLVTQTMESRQKWNESIKTAQ